mmetsp:Transcript_26007/g.34645  ORF Transcript_26007/g.34645 Transcript_26007/m.34645 type:complete len:213 (+) Transcript_26007:214-852(+)
MHRVSMLQSDAHLTLQSPSTTKLWPPSKLDNHQPKVLSPLHSSHQSKDNHGHPRVLITLLIYATLLLITHMNSNWMKLTSISKRTPSKNLSVLAILTFNTAQSTNGSYVCLTIHFICTSIPCKLYLKIMNVVKIMNMESFTIPSPYVMKAWAGQDVKYVLHLLTLVVKLLCSAICLSMEIKGQWHFSMLWEDPLSRMNRGCMNAQVVCAMSQ